MGLLLTMAGMGVRATVTDPVDPGDPSGVSAKVVSQTLIKVSYTDATTDSLVGRTFKKNGAPLIPTAVESRNGAYYFTVPETSAGDVITHSSDGTNGKTFADAPVSNWSSHPLLGDTVWLAYMDSYGYNPYSWELKVRQAYNMPPEGSKQPGGTLQMVSGYNPYFQPGSLPVYIGSPDPPHSYGTGGPYYHYYLVVALGLNDILKNNGSFTVAGWTAAANALIDEALSKGWPSVDRLIFATPYWIPQAGRDAQVGMNNVITAADEARHEAYVRAVIDLCDTRGVRCLDVYTHVKNLPNRLDFMAPDSIHYLENGHTELASYTSKIL